MQLAKVRLVGCNKVVRILCTLLDLLTVNSRMLMFVFEGAAKIPLTFSAFYSTVDLQWRYDN